MPDYFSLPPVNRVFIDNEVFDKKYVKDIIKRFSEFPQYKNTKIERIDSYRNLPEEISALSAAEAKKVLVIYPEKGQFLHACPGSDGVVCCRYFVLDFGMNCPYDCHYCYLQTYAKIPYLTLAGNIEDMLVTLREKLLNSGDIHWRIGSGEYMDSLALERITHMGKLLVEFFSEFSNVTFELKTKSIEIDSVLNLKHNKNTVISWSMNPDFIIESTELNCSSLNERLNAAAKVIEKGYQCGFHFDPIIIFDNWEEEYLSVIEKLFNKIPVESIRWISLGTFRYSPGLKEVLRIKHPEEFITKGELLLSDKTKFRYPAPLRNRVYQRLWNKIKSYDPDMMIYLCMETRDAWKRLNNSHMAGPSLLDMQFEKRRLKLI